MVSGKDHPCISRPSFLYEIESVFSRATGATDEYTEHRIWYFTDTKPTESTQCNESIQNYNLNYNKRKSEISYMQDLFLGEKDT